MRRSGVLLAVIGVFSVLLAGCTREAAREQGPAQARVGRPAPDFTLPSSNGGKVALSDFAGKPVLLYFSMGPG
jgi:cytochrome oxidase Cu insertion factor (SCO1/SenC/PrrC family)